MIRIGRKKILHACYAFLLLLGGFFLLNVLAQALGPEQVKITRQFPNGTYPQVVFEESIIANPILFQSKDGAVILVPNSNGTIYALNSETGALEWRLTAPAPEGQTIQLAATPALVNDKLVVGYQCVDKGIRVSHRVAVFDLLRKTLDHSFSILTLAAEKPASDGKGVVKFNPPTAYSHAALKYVAKTNAVWGNIYMTFGNAGDTQPFHGWLFEIDMEKWQLQGSHHAIQNVLLTTPEADCPVTMPYGTQEMICGGGIWTPPGPQIFPKGKSFEIVLPVGNGQTDLARHDYANTLMRVKPGLEFNPECDENLCRNFNPSQPDEACMASCKNLFIPRLQAGDPALLPANGECDGKTFWECLAWMDYDLGANAPIKARVNNGKTVLIQPGKEGAVYLIDADHLGTQYDRLQVIEPCGTATDVCKASWMGMLVTQPVLTYVNQEPVVILSGFAPDKSHPAGLIALKIITDHGKPTFKRLWQFPDPKSSYALRAYRSHPSLPILSKLKQTGDEIVWSVNIGDPGTLYGIRVNDGKVLVKQPLLGTGRQNSIPVIYQDKIYLASSHAGTGKSFIEAYRFK